MRDKRVFWGEIFMFFVEKIDVWLKEDERKGFTGVWGAEGSLERCLCPSTLPINIHSHFFRNSKISHHTSHSTFI